MCCQKLSNLIMTTFSIFFSLSSLIFIPVPLKSHSNSSIFNPLGLSPCSFNYYLFYLKLFIKLEFLFNFIPLQFFFYISNLFSIFLLLVVPFKIIFKFDFFFIISYSLVFFLSNSIPILFISIFFLL